MVVKQVNVEDGQQAWHDVFDLLGFKPDINDRRGRRAAMLEHQFAKVAITRNQNSVGLNGMGQNGRIASIRHDMDRALDIMPGRNKGAGNDTADVVIAQEPQAAFALPIAT